VKKLTVKKLTVKKLGITQRVESIAAYGERRDCLDQRWSKLASNLDCCIVPLANVPAADASDYLDELQLDAIILSGGNSLTSIAPEAEDAAPERDAFEEALLREALIRSIPVLGICRGMQFINVFFGGSLQPIDGHAGTAHAISVTPPFSECVSNTVNSFHNWAIPASDLAKECEAFAYDAEGNIEGFKHTTQSVAGIMWHPEREMPFQDKDILLIKKFIL
jgi:gamma-glutamyl-gamma-aminobutyrate hydrolase PuuD